MQMIFTSLGRSKKRKPTAKQRELTNSWNNLLKQYETKTQVKKYGQELSLSYSLGTPAGRETPGYPSYSTGQGNATLKENPVYTGTKVVGIATLHKSNGIPVFSNEEAIDISKMRRG
jgi:hypothetical protein